MAKGRQQPTPSAAAQASKGAKTYGRYKVLSPLGQGAMASVFLAEDPSLGRLVAIKVIHSHLAGQADLLTRFTSEAKTAAALRSPNIVEIFDYGFEGGAQYLVMEYIDGPTLQHVLNLQMGEPLSPELAACLAVQAAEGLMVAERKGVVHRDIKPENLMLTSNGLLKIADFGIAHINEQNLTRTGSLLGSPSYMAPEQIEGAKPSHQTDMFALGAVFYACLTGRKPFNGPNIPAIFRAICELPHKPVEECVPDLDPKLVELSTQLLNKKSEERGGGAKVLAGQLRQWLNQRGIYDPSEPVQALLTTVQDAANRTMVESGGSAPVSTPAPAAKPAKAETPSTQAPEPQKVEANSNDSKKAEPKKPEPKKTETKKPETTKSEPKKGEVKISDLEFTSFGEESPDSAEPDLAPSDSTVKPSPKLGERDASNAVPKPAQATQALPKWAIPALGGSALVLVIVVLILALGGEEPASETTAGAANSESGVSASTPRAAATSEAATPVRDTVKPVLSGQDTATPAPAGTAASNTAAAATGPASKDPAASPASATSAASGTSATDTAAVKAQPDSTELQITSAPPFAEVFLGTRFMGTTPFKKTVPATRYKILLNHRRFVSIDTVVRLKPGKTTLKFRFTEAKPQ